jgi:ABC-type bacteriocin/lantibiotic exporter with double-glycine peptidase domain
MFGLSVNMIVTVLQVAVLGLGSWLVLHGRLSLGGLVAFMSMMGQVISPVTSLAGIGQGIQAATGALVRVNEVLDAPVEMEQAEGAAVLAPLARSIVLKDVSFSYAPGQRTLEGLNVEIKAGQKVAFVGPTGAGKSSVLQLIMRFYEPDEGAVLFDGVDLKTATIASSRAQIGAVFQETFLFNATVRENIALGRPGATTSEVEAAARAAEMADFIEGLPRGYETLVGERGGRLSGGQGSRSREPCCEIPGSCCWTRRRRRWTLARSA